MKFRKRFTIPHRRLITPLLLLAALPGCYKYVPASGGAASIERGEKMRVSLTRPLEVDLGEIKMNDAVMVSGEFIEEREDGTILLSILEATSPSGAQRDGTGATVTIPADAIASVERRVLNAGATALSAAAVAGGAVAIGVAAGGGDGAGDSGGGGGPPTQE